MKIDIIGAGSLGLLLAGKLIVSGAEIRLWCRTADQSKALETKGLTINDDGVEYVILPGNKFMAAPVSRYAETHLRQPGDWTVLTVKQNALHHELPEILLPLRESCMQLVCFQNGYGHLEMLQELLPKAMIWTAVTTEAANRKTWTEVVHAGKGETYIGEAKYSQKNGEEREERDVSGGISLIETLTAAGFSASMSKEVDTMIYRKLLINAVINPLTAIWRIPNGELLSSESRVLIMKELYEETIAVYEACGIAYEIHAWESILQVCRSTSGNISSMLADVLASKVTEIRWINGSIVGMAERSGVEVPTNRLICRLIEGMLARER